MRMMRYIILTQHFYSLKNIISGYFIEQIMSILKKLKRYVGQENMIMDSHYMLLGIR